MKSKFPIIAMLIWTAFSLVSCLEDDDNDYVYYDDSAISTFSVKTAKQYIHTTTKSGKDSVYTKTLSLSAYKFVIDQKNCEIYNLDSLPYGVDATKLLVTTSAVNSGAVYLQSTTSDSVTYVSSTDSLDFSQMRVLHAVSMSGKATRKYKVDVRVHQEQADSFVWSKMAPTLLFSQMKNAKTFAVTTADGSPRLFLLGSDGTNTTIFTMTGNGSWTKAEPNFNHMLAADAYNKAIVKNDSLYIVDNSNILRTADGNIWEQTGTATNVARLVAASTAAIYGYDKDGKLLQSNDGGFTWKSSGIDADATLLPLGETAYATLPLKTNSNAWRTLLIGTRPGYDDSTLAIWGKIDETDKYSEPQSWSYYNPSDFNHKQLPMLKNIYAGVYDNAVLLSGTSQTGHSAFYRSDDCGLTWEEDSVVSFPLNLVIDTHTVVAVGGDNFVWIVDTKSGNTWRGRTNRLGWKKEQYEYTE